MYRLFGVVCKRIDFAQPECGMPRDDFELRYRTPKLGASRESVLSVEHDRVTFHYGALAVDVRAN